MDLGAGPVRHQLGRPIQGGARARGGGSHLGNPKRVSSGRVTTQLPKVTTDHRSDMIKIAPNQEILISVCTSQGCTKEISAWTTEVPGLLVIRNGRCGLSDCYAVLPCALGDALGI